MKKLQNHAKAEGIRLLILDLDGTIADTIGSIRDGINLAMNRYGFPERSYEQIREAIGNGARELVRRSMPVEAAADGALVDGVLADYHRLYGQTYLNCRECYGGIPEALTALKERGYTLAVLSNKQDVYVKGLVRSLLPEGLISYAAGQTEKPKKPDPTVPLEIAEMLGFSPEETAFLGDSEVDIQTARNAGMMAVACSWGYRERSVLLEYEPDRLLDSVSELTEMFA